MSILGQIIGGLLGGSGGSGSPMQNVLVNLLSGQGGAGGQPNQAPGAFGGQLGGGQLGGGQLGGGGGGGAFGGGGGSGVGAGGLGGLVSAFQQAGLGNVVQSWIGNGANEPVSPQQLQNVFGDQQVQSMASQSGMGKEDFLSQLSQHLPNAVNGVTPNGRLPDEGTVSV